jgi:hypothetical protein
MQDGTASWSVMHPLPVATNLTGCLAHKRIKSASGKVLGAEPHTGIDDVHVLFQSGADDVKVLFRPPAMMFHVLLLRYIRNSVVCTEFHEYLLTNPSSVRHAQSHKRWTCEVSHIAQVHDCFTKKRPRTW